METKTQNFISRPPVVVVLGHIDHGKTSLLRAVRKLQFTEEKPEGTITQHIGAYQIEKDGKKITFIDTPGHEAFSALRARGTKVADIAILVVDASQGVQSQTKEAISQIKLANIPFIVALNKIDKPDANPEKIKRELAKEGVLVESLGGKVPSVEISAKTGKGIEELLELIVLMGEMEELKADLKKPGEGVVIESYLDNQKGPVATLILNEGVLRKGEILGTPSTFGKIKGLENFQGKAIEEVFPSDPVLVIGLEDVAKVGENFKVFPDLESAKSYLQIKEAKKKENNLPQVLQILPHQKVLNLILKADVWGSLEAMEKILREIPQEKVILRILNSQVGQIKETDIKLAKTAKAIILAFRVKIDLVAQKLCEKEKVKIFQFNVIYDMVEAVYKLLEKMTKAEEVKVELGKVKILALFLTEKNRQIIGGKVIEGEVKKGAEVEILRKEEILGKGKIINLQRNKKDVEKVAKGQECGILFEGELKVEENDILLVFEKRKPEL